MVPIFLKTRSGHVIYVQSPDSDGVDVAVRLARAAEGLDGSLDREDLLQGGHIVSWAIGQPAREELERSLET